MKRLITLALVVTLVGCSSTSIETVKSNPFVVFLGYCSIVPIEDGGAITCQSDLPLKKTFKGDGK